ncbi:YmfQ family protein [Trabulsiella odontotermitis]|uniref:Phage tail protein n=1 Tax=Trabulsiella odontotermitis TaxID=379893 RepID=A0A0L0GVM7_9ENTR|nr:putative phage tail protein [Trabulsiella odontotermitis]KNC92781.1 phage tail protein [Trabulsiella odontotermitis]
MNYRELLGILLPAEAYDPNGEQIAAEHEAEGNALQKAEDAADRVAQGVVPLNPNELLPDWERVLGLTPSPGATVQERLSLVKAMINATGGLSIPYFINLAKSLGYTITIDEPQPFRVGVNRMGDALYTRDTIWIWRVNVWNTQNPVYRFRTGRSAMGERLLSFGKSHLEEIFQDLKPAHTFCHFVYKQV